MELNDSSMNAGPRADVVLSSRVSALRECAEVVAEGAGPIVVSGEAGIGKTWLRKRISSEAQGLGWIEVDATPAWTSAELIRAIARSAGLGRLADAAAARTAIDEFFIEESENGRRWALAIDEAQNASDEILEEVRVLANRLGRAEGFEGIILAGQTSLARRLGLRGLAGLASRLAARVRLRPIDADEARILLNARFPDRSWDVDVVERLQRDAWGNPSRLLTMAERLSPRAQRSTPRRAVAPIAEPEREISEGTSAPILGAGKPPIRLEDGLIEVGWEADSAAEPSNVPESDSVAERFEARRPIEAAVLEAIEAIDDPYAAIQAWNEWTRNRRVDESLRVEPERRSADPTEPSDLEESRSLDSETIAVRDPIAERGDGRVWTDDPHDFAPYSRLFTRPRSLSDRESNE